MSQGSEVSTVTPDGLSAIEARLDELTDLFRRRLLDDKDKRRLIDEAHEHSGRLAPGRSASSYTLW